MNRSELIRAAEILAAHGELEDEALARLLVGAGFEEGPAHRAVAFFPSAFARPLLETLGISTFSDRAAVIAPDNGGFEILLADQPEYVAALALAREHWRTGVMDGEIYKRVAFRSAELDSVNAALNAGADIADSAVAIALNCSGNADHFIRG